jgi:biotin carboxyl carrier protein
MLKIQTQALLIPLLLALAGSARPDDLAAIRQALQAKYDLTTTTADKSDIVKAGAVVVLKKSNLVTVDVMNRNLFRNTYKNGRITQALSPFIVDRIQQNARRTFVSGEKLWVTDIEVDDKGVIISVYSDPFDNVRYGAPLRFPFEKGSSPSVSQVTAEVAEVFDVQASDDQKPAQSQAAAPARPAAQPAEPAAASAPPPPAPIAPPPPPPADPKTIALGQTSDQVIANFGQPNKILKPAGKQIYVYSDMKVAFVNGRVTDVQ